MKLTNLPVIRVIAEEYRELLTARGRYLLVSTGAIALLGLNTRTNQVFKVFALTAGIMGLAFVFSMLWAPAVELACKMPTRATARRRVFLGAHVKALGGSFVRPLLVSFPRSRGEDGGLRYEPRQSVLFAGSGGQAQARVALTARQRGRYLLRGPTVRATDPLALVAGRAVRLPDQILLVYPRTFSMEQFHIPLGRRYQPGGIPLASHTGDTVEFMGTREYRQGDPVKNIHWRSWARVGEPVVKEFQEEYFCRIALILDTFVPGKPSEADLEAFEGSVSLVASIADYFSRSEYIVDIFAAGPEIYEVSVGRSLAYLENILDVLACIEPCQTAPFEALAPALFEKLSQITSVVAVLSDWDDSRESFLRRIKSLGTEVRTLVVKEGATQKPWEGAAEDLGEITVYRPRDLERSLEAETTRAGA